MHVSAAAVEAAAAAATAPSTPTPALRWSWTTAQLAARPKWSDPPRRTGQPVSRPEITENRRGEECRRTGVWEEVVRPPCSLPLSLAVRRVSLLLPEPSTTLWCSLLKVNSIAVVGRSRPGRIELGGRGWWPSHTRGEWMEETERGTLLLLSSTKTPRGLEKS